MRAVGVEAVGELEDGVGGAEGIVLGADIELEFQDVGGVEQEAAEAVGGGGPDFLAAALKMRSEEAMLEFPAVKGGAVDAEAAGDFGVVLAVD